MNDDSDCCQPHDTDFGGRGCVHVHGYAHVHGHGYAHAHDCYDVGC